MLSSIFRCSKASSRALHTARVLRNQKWSQLTNILAGEIPPPVQVKSISTEGLLLQDGRLFPSACIFLEGEVILWDVPPTLWSGWDESRFEIFDVVVPKPGAFLLVHDGETRSDVVSLSFARNLIDWNGKICQPSASYLAPVLEQVGHPG